MVPTCSACSRPRPAADAPKDAGYEYVNIDDCWSVRSGRDGETQQLVPDPDKFPDGIRGLAQKVHHLGLKIGIYSSAGTLTCAGYPASIGYESIDAATFAAWDIDCAPRSPVPSWQRASRG